MSKKRTAPSAGQDRSLPPPGYEEAGFASLESLRCDPDLVHNLDCLPPFNFLSSRPGQGGKKQYYLSVSDTIRLANLIFGHSGWSSRVESHSVDEVIQKPSGSFVCQATVVVRVDCLCTFCSARPRSACHTGIAVDVSEQKGKTVAISNAIKSAESYAMKRALRKFGRVFGDFVTDKTSLDAVIARRKTEDKTDFFEPSSVKGPVSRGQSSPLRVPKAEPVSREGTSDLHLLDQDILKDVEFSDEGF